MTGTKVARNDSYVRPCRCGHHGPPSSESEQFEQPPCSWSRSSDAPTVQSSAAAASDGRQIVSNPMCPSSSMQRTEPGPPRITPERKTRHIGHSRNLRKQSFTITYYTAKSCNRQLNSSDAPVSSTLKYPQEFALTQDRQGRLARNQPTQNGLTAPAWRFAATQAAAPQRSACRVGGGRTQATSEIQTDTRAAFLRTPEPTVSGAIFCFPF